MNIDNKEFEQEVIKRLDELLERVGLLEQEYDKINREFYGETEEYPLSYIDEIEYR